MSEKYFLWPDFSWKNTLGKSWHCKAVDAVEDRLSEMFPGFPVLCSSGRAALGLALFGSNLHRPDLVGVFPYASHCVLDTIARSATPLPGEFAKEAPIRLIYHQWSYVQQTELKPNSIEDSVDTLCVPGTDLFPGGGNFEIWSLPKILGTSSGGVLWCRDPDSAKRLRYERDRRGGSWFLWLLRMLGHRFGNAYLAWQGMESSHGDLCRFQIGEIDAAISEWDQILIDRKNKLDIIWPLAVDWLQKPVNRMPPVVPVPPTMPEQDIIKNGCTAGFRMMQKKHQNGAFTLEKVLPVPIHQQVTVEWLDLIKNEIGKPGASAKTINV